MATYEQGANGAFSGKAGSVIGSNWRSIGYLRGLARFKSKSTSPLQAAQRARFGMAVSFLRPMKAILNLGFNDKVRNTSTGYNEGMRSFMKNAIIGEYPALDIDYSKIEISRGDLVKLVGITVAESTPGTLTFSWTDIGDTEHGYSDDKLYLLVYNKTEDIFATYKGAERKDEVMDIVMPPVFSGNEFHLYAFVLHREGKRASSSQYVGTITLA